MPFPNTREHIDRNANATMAGMVPVAAAGLLMGQGLANVAEKSVLTLFQKARNGYLVGGAICFVLMAWSCLAPLLGRAPFLGVPGFALLALVFQFTLLAMARIAFLRRVQATLPHSSIWVLMAIASFGVLFYLGETQGIDLRDQQIGWVDMLKQLGVTWLVLEVFFWMGLAWSLAVFGRALRIEPSRHAAFESYRHDVFTFVHQQMRARFFSSHLKGMAAATLAVLAYAAFVGAL